MEEETPPIPNAEHPSPEKWYTPLTRATPLSKAFAMGLFILLPFVGFVVGVGYVSRIDDQTVSDSLQEQDSIYVDKQSNRPVDNTSTVEESESNDGLAKTPKLLSVHEIQVGDTIAGLVVKSVQIWPAVHSDGSQDFAVEFNGTTMVHGVLYGPGYACDLGITVAQDSDLSLPSFREYTDANHLCFTNADDVLRFSGEQPLTDGSEVNVVIQDFVFTYSHKGGGHTATYVSAYEKQGETEKEGPF